MSIIINIISLKFEKKKKLLRPIQIIIIYPLIIVYYSYNINYFGT